MRMVSYRRVGRLHFLRVGRVALTFCWSKASRAIKQRQRVPSIVYAVPLFEPTAESVVDRH